jgi:hypothetical protein
VTPATALTLYLLVDLGERIDLEVAATHLGRAGTGRVRPSRTIAEAIQVPNPPLVAPLEVPAGFPVPAGTAARASVLLFDFGVASLRLRVEWPAGARWAEVRDRSAALIHADVGPWFAPVLERLRHEIGRAVQQPDLAAQGQEYAILRLIGDARAVALEEADLAALLLDERRPLATTGHEMLLARDYRYTELDRTVVGYDAAVVVDPDGDDEDVEYLLEFANAQLLELQVYDGVLDAQAPPLEDAVRGSRRPRRPLGRHYHDLQMRMFELSSRTERLIQQADNALTITDDVYLARVYRGALDVMLEPAWRRSIDRKLGLVREAYGVLSTEAQAARSELLEVLIIVLIAVEIGLALLGVLR